MTYIREPMAVVDGIPVFCASDEFTENYEQIGRDYLKHFDRTGKNPWQTNKQLDYMQAPTAQAVIRHSNPNDLILDVGVSDGRLLKEIPDRQLYGVDISLDCLRRAKNHGIVVACARAESLPYEDEMFHLVNCSDVLEHVQDLNAVVRELYRVLKPGGFLVVRVPKEESLDSYLYDSSPYKFIHLRLFDDSTLRILFTRIFPFTIISGSLLQTKGATEILMVVQK